MNPTLDPFGGIFDSIGNYLSATGFLDAFLIFSTQSPVTIAWELFSHGGWLVIVILYLWGMYQFVFMEYRSGQFMGKWKHTLLAIDIPKNNEQTPKAVENIFSALAGVYTSSNLIDRFWNGKVTESFSFEIVSIEGHTRFLIRTPNQFRDFIESVIYSQYPDAEINEVSDYVDYDTEEIDPKTGEPLTFRQLPFPNKSYNMWGAEFVLVKTYPYPIKTYPEFEHQQTQTFLDPMANLMEIMSRIGAGEQIWIQLVIQPQPPGWGEEAKKIVSKLQGREYKPPESFDPTKLVSVPMEGAASWGSGLLGELTGTPWGAATVDKKKEEDQWRMFKITPGERSVLERVEQKLSKQAFKVRFRMLYIGKHQVFSKGRGVTGVAGAFQQFNTSDANAFKPNGYTKTSADYFFVDQRIAKKQTRLLRWYCNRSAWYGESNEMTKLTLLNPEELATLWHFPVMTVKAVQVEKIDSKKSAPPTRLPYMERVGPSPKREERQPTRIQPSAPTAPDLNAPQAPTVTPRIMPIQPGALIEPIVFESSIAPVAPRGPGAEVKISPLGPNEPPDRKGAPPSNLPFA